MVTDFFGWKAQNDLCLVLKMPSTYLVPEECKENGGVRGDPKDGNAAVENHKHILMDQGKPEKNTQMSKKELTNTIKPHSGGPEEA